MTYLRTADGRSLRKAAGFAFWQRQRLSQDRTEVTDVADGVDIGGASMGPAMFLPRAVSLGTG